MNLQPWLPAQDSPEVIVNENFEALSHMATFAKDPTTTAGLTWGYLGGRWGGFTITPGTLTLTPSSTLYITASRSTGIVNASDVAVDWDNVASHARIYKLTTGAATVTAVEDYRAGQGGAHGISGASGALSGLGDVDIGTPADGQVLVYSASLGKWIAGAGGGGGGGRTLLTSNRTYYVSVTGSDSASGLSEGNAFATLAKAEAVITGTLDMGGCDVTIKLADGTYPAGVVLRRLTGSGNAILEGNSSSPGSVIINVSTGDAVRAEGNGSDWLVRNLRVNAAAGAGLDARNGAWLRHSGIVFGSCGAAHIVLSGGARAQCAGAYTIAAAAPYHLRQYSGTQYTHTGIAITASAAVTFSSAFIDALGAGCVFRGFTLSGSAISGKRYNLSLLAFLDAGAASASLPGSSAGTAATGAEVQ